VVQLSGNREMVRALSAEIHCYFTERMTMLFQKMLFIFFKNYLRVGLKEKP
jgi:hypothetical protein